jgi:hypothetical protein
MRVQNAPVAPPSTYNASCSPGLDAIVLKALAKSPDERYLSAAAMRDALDELRKKQQINATSREVSEWFEWAFALEQPEPSARTSARVTPPTLSSTTRSSSNLSQPAPGLYTPPTGSMDFFNRDSLPPMESDEEVMEIAWGGRETNAPVLLDDVPDRSGPMLFEEEESEPSSPALMSLNPAASSGGTLLTYIPPPPKLGETSRSKDHDRSLAAGTALPSAGRGFEMPTPLPVEIAQVEADALAQFEARMREELSGSHTIPKATGTPVKKRDTPLPNKFARASTPGLLINPVIAKPAAPARTITPIPSASRSAIVQAVPASPTEKVQPLSRQRGVRASTEFGSHIVERDKASWHRGLVAGAIILAIAAGVFALTRTKGHKSAASAGDNATLKIVVEPRDATITVKGHSTHERSPVRVKLPAKSYTIEISSDGYQSWSSAITMESNETQTLRVALAPEGSSEKARAVKTSEPAAPTSEKAAPRDVDEAARAAERRRKRRRARKAEEDVTIDDTRQEDSPAASSKPLSGAVSLTPLSVKASEPPRAQRTQRPKGPMVVPPNAVRKRAGSTPRIRVRSGEAAPPSRLSARLCIDRRGKVTSASVLTAVSSNVKATVEKALSRWRYAPYRHKGERVRACFAVSFRTR